MCISTLFDVWRNKIMSETKVKVLNKGHVELIDHMGTDHTICCAARVSFDSISTLETDGSLSVKDQKLIEYLAKHNHWTPFGHPQITLRIKAPISIRTQLFKHKVGFTENEISRRYVTHAPEVYFPMWRTKPINGAKQGSDEFLEINSTHNLCSTTYEFAVKLAFDAYETLLNNGVAPEQARFVLPQGTYTEWYWTGSLAAYARVYKLRSDPHAQYEVREYAKAISDVISPLFPVSWGVLTK